MDDFNDDIDLTDEYEVLEQNVLDPPIINNSPTLLPSGGEQAAPQPSVESPTVDNSLAEKYRSAFAAAQSPEEHDAIANAFKTEFNARQSALPNLGMFESGTPLTDKGALLKSLKNGSFSVNPEITRSFTDRVEYHLGINLGPCSTANIDSVLTAWESDNGFCLLPDDFGIYRKFKNGIMDSDDAYKVSILDRAYDKAVHDAFTELLASSSDVSTKNADNSRMDIKTDTSYGPGLSDDFKQGLGLDSSGRNIVGSGGNNGSDLVFRDNGQAIQGKIDVVALSTSYKNYWFDQQRAVDYAHQFWLVPNIPDYHFYKFSDCTNFVSQCWAFAGIPTTEDGWAPGTLAWTTVDGFAQYHVAAGNCYLSYSSSDAKVGDVIQFYNDSKGWYHAVIITKIDDDGNIYYSGHTWPRDDKALSEVYPGSGDQIRFLCVKEQLRQPRDIINLA